MKSIETQKPSELNIDGQENYRLENLTVEVERSGRGHLISFHKTEGKSFFVKTVKNGETLDVLEFDRPTMHKKEEIIQIISFLNGFAASRGLSFFQSLNTAEITY